MTKHEEEEKVRIVLTRPVEGGYGPGPADVPASVAHRLVAGGVATIADPDEKPARRRSAESDENPSAEEATGDDAPARRRRR